MFTVIICDEHIIKDCYHKYHIYLKPFFDNDNFAFCAWNAKAETLDEALPKLKAIIQHKKEWRAIVVNDSSTWGFEGVNKRNPFDYVDSKKKKYQFSSFEQVKDFRETENALFDKALSNPLTKLSIWLCGTPVNTPPILCYDKAKEEVDNVDSGEAYYKLLEELELKSSDVEIDWSRNLKFSKLSENFELRGELFNPPKSVTTIAERAKNVDTELAELAWTNHTEFDYSQFYIDNLYPEKLRYLIFEVSYIKGRRNENLYFNFLTTIMLLATYDCPQGVLRSNRVYKLDMQIDAECVRDLCNAYNSKLYSTLAKIDEISKNLKDKESQPIDKYTAEECFESNVTVPIEVVTKESRDNLKANFSKIGLSKDCPSDEYEYWDDQFHTINKYFIRFLREPRRAVKTATKEDFRTMNQIEDERALRLNEYQKEDVMYVLEEEERNMLATSTTQLFNTAQYNKKMREADKEIRRGIAQRMTKKKTMFVGLFAVLAYLVGFFPLFFGNFNTTKSFLFSLIVTGVVLGIFLVIGFIYLFVLRHKLVNRFKHFNYVMSGILKEIENGVNAFSRYLSHACNVMREFSVLNYSESSYKKKQHILSNHKRIIGEKISEVNELFSTYIDSDEIRLAYDAEPYNYDFTVLKDYEYDIPYAEVRKDIDFLQEGNKIVVPIDYVETFTLTREELYD